MFVNLIFDPTSAAFAPASFFEGMEKAALILDQAIYNPITVNIVVEYDGAFGQGDNTDGNILTPVPVPYSLLYPTLWLNDTNSVDGLPLATTLDGREFFTVGTAQAKAFGWIPGNLAIPDGFVDIGKEWTGNGLIDAATHELTHAMGRLDSYGSLITALDLFRYNSNTGQHVFDTGTPATPAYFSMDGGNTHLADFGITSDPGDFLKDGMQDSGLPLPDPFDETGQTDTGLGYLTNADLQIMDAIGFRDAFSNPFEPQSALPVSVGGMATLSHDFLSSIDPAATADQLTYTIVSGPQHGAILDNGVPVTSFTQADIDSGRVQYVNSGDGANSDGFTFQLFGPFGNHTPTEPFTIAILNQMGPAVEGGGRVSVPDGGGAPILNFALDTVALGNTPDQVIYQLTAAPEHGEVLIGGVQFNYFTQAQIDDGLVQYANDGDGASSDSFSFVAWDSDAEWTAGTFNILMQPAAGTGSAAAQQTVAGAGDSGTSWRGSDAARLSARWGRRFPRQRVERHPCAQSDERRCRRITVG
jgi:hypothetical protein